MVLLRHRSTSISICIFMYSVTSITFAILLILIPIGAFFAILRIVTYIVFNHSTRVLVSIFVPDCFSVIYVFIMLRPFWFFMIWLFLDFFPSILLLLLLTHEVMLSNYLRVYENVLILSRFCGRWLLGMPLSTCFSSRCCVLTRSTQVCIICYRHSWLLNASRFLKFHFLSLVAHVSFLPFESCRLFLFFAVLRLHIVLIKCISHPILRLC